MREIQPILWTATLALCQFTHMSPPNSIPTQLRSLLVVFLCVSAMVPATPVQAGPLLVYTMAQSRKGTTWLHNTSKSLVVKAESFPLTEFIIRDPAQRLEAVITTEIVGKAKYYVLPIPSNGGFLDTLTFSYLPETRFLNYAENKPSIGLEVRNRHLEGTGSLSAYTIQGRDAAIAVPLPTVANPKNVLTVWTPSTFTLTGRSIFDREITSTSPDVLRWPHLGRAITNLTLTGSMKLSAAYTRSVNNPDAKDLTAPVALIPGTFPYATYRMEKLLRAARYLPKP